MPTVNTNSETGIKGFTYDDAFDVVVGAMNASVVSAPKNESKFATIAGPSNASKKSVRNQSEFLYAQ